ncbi:MAG: sulfotransferase [Alphaproteobacteria bacterium]
MLNKAIMICGAGHSGSTLLGFILGGLPHAFYMGEGAKLRYLRDERKPLRKRVCKLCGPDCSVWADFNYDPTLPVYEQVAAHTGASVTIDSTKNPDWIAARAEELRATGTVGYLIRLLRDGRAVMNSRFRKYPDRNPTEQISAWMDQIRATETLYGNYSGPKLTLHYEQLATDAEWTARRLCAFLELPFDPSLLDYGNKEHHPLGGNNGTQTLVAKRQGRMRGDFVPGNARSRDYYENHSGGIELDLRWQTEMNADRIALFEKLAGTLNERLRWEHVSK